MFKLATETIYRLVDFAEAKGLVYPIDRAYAINRLLDVMQLPAPEMIEYTPEEAPETATKYLETLADCAFRMGNISNSRENRDLFITKVMGVLTPSPAEVREKFAKLESASPEAATSWFYQLCRDSDYIKVDRIAKNQQFFEDSPAGKLEITINLSKPEKDPRDIAAARNRPQVGYPKCMLCIENPGYAGRIGFPARQNHRVIPVTLGGQQWFMQYSPYLYYNEHCIVFNSQHIPMKIDKSAFEKLLDFVTAFPHYFVGSNADLPIVGGSILSHEHFQGGHYTFAMETAPVEKEVVFAGYEDVNAGIVKWPMSVLRLRGADKARIAELADKILIAWRGYSDETVGVVAFSDNEPHNTITPIARRRGADYELDLVLRCNITTAEHPLGVFHPHAEKHHIKKENIGLIEVMGLAVLPSRLKKELADLRSAILAGSDIRADEVLAKHADWVDELKTQYAFTEENAEDILLAETGKVFAAVLEDAGVYKRDAEGQAAFLRFVEVVNH